MKVALIALKGLRIELSKALAGNLKEFLTFIINASSAKKQPNIFDEKE